MPADHGPAFGPLHAAIPSEEPAKHHSCLYEAVSIVEQGHESLTAKLALQCGAAKVRIIGQNQKVATLLQEA